MFVLIWLQKVHCSDMKSMVRLCVNYPQFIGMSHLNRSSVSLQDGVADLAMRG